MVALIRKPEESEVLFAEEKCTATNGGMGGEPHAKTNFPYVRVIPQQRSTIFWMRMGPLASESSYGPGLLMTNLKRIDKRINYSVICERKTGLLKGF